MLIKSQVLKANSHVCASLTVFEILQFKTYNLENLVKVIQFKSLNGIIRWQISYHFRDIKFLFLLTSKSMSKSRSFIFAITPFDCQCKNLQMSPRHFFRASSYRFTDIKDLNFLPQKSRSRSRSTIFAITSIDGKCENLRTSFFTFFFYFR